MKFRERHLSYFAVLDSFNSKECPVCSLVKSGVERYFDNLLHENINDVGFRNKFYKEHGFCNYHSHKFLSYNDGLAIALTHRDLLVERIKILEAGDTKRLFKKKITYSCMVCDLVKETEERYILVIIEYLDDTEFKDKFLLSQGLCIPHYETLLLKAKLLPKWLTDFHIKRYKELLSRLEHYIDSCNFSLGIVGGDESAWRRIISVLFGYEGRF